MGTEKEGVYLMMVLLLFGMFFSYVTFRIVTSAGM